jgi:hypothetical protein
VLVKVRALAAGFVVAITLSACNDTHNSPPVQSGTATASASPSPSSAASQPPATALIPPRGPIFDVTAYGARGDGSTDNTNAFAQAIAAAQNVSGGGTVRIPAGHFLFTQKQTPRPASVVVEGSTPIVVIGAGRDQTTLVESNKDKGLLSVRVDGTVVEALTLDTQSNDGGAAIFVVANHTTLLSARVLGGAHHFALYYAGPQGAKPDAPQYNSGNTVRDLDLNDLLCDDGFSWSFQQDSSITGVTHTGSRLALYIVRSTQVTDYTYTPGPQQCGARNAFWITPPSSNITIDGFTSSGEGGKVAVIASGAAGRVGSDITIRNERMTGSGTTLAVGDVTNLVLENCDLGGNNIVVRPQQVARMRVVGSRYGSIRRNPAAGAQVDVATS